ncbi:MAG: RdgB/HAM1 family non-canonical purine NTP pyrophosphatase [Candidatus Omnitrophica bacterium]|nr:RdgB/HAM1 family non-canonical purine NTP pyrophosphatase [Candidatus Omnitrophota bacterium]
MRLIIATKNKNKFKEIKDILKNLPIYVIYLGEINKNFKIKEDGKSFFDNALKKAMVVSKSYPEDFVVGEDSGIEVDYLNNRPGIFSARYAGKNATDIKNNLKLLKELDGLAKSKRKAHYRCYLVLVKGGKFLKKFCGSWSGYINDKPVGKNGFGYDPIFYLPLYKKTAAQLPLEEKNRISHRAKAFRKLKNYLSNNFLKKNFS